LIGIRLEQILSILSNHEAIPITQGESTAGSFLMALMGCFQNQSAPESCNTPSEWASIIHPLGYQDEEVSSALTLDRVFVEIIENRDLSAETEEVENRPGERRRMIQFLFEDSSPDRRGIVGLPLDEQNGHERHAEIQAGLQPGNTPNINEVFVQPFPGSINTAEEPVYDDGLPWNNMSEDRRPGNRDGAGQDINALGRRDGPLLEKDRGLFIENVANEWAPPEARLRRNMLLFRPFPNPVDAQKGQADNEISGNMAVEKGSSGNHSVMESGTRTPGQQDGRILERAEELFLEKGKNEWLLEKSINNGKALPIEPVVGSPDIAHKQAAKSGVGRGMTEHRHLEYNQVAERNTRIIPPSPVIINTSELDAMEENTGSVFQQKKMDGEPKPQDERSTLRMRGFVTEKGENGNKQTSSRASGDVLNGIRLREGAFRGVLAESSVKGKETHVVKTDTEVNDVSSNRVLAGELRPVEDAAEPSLAPHVQMRMNSATRSSQIITMEETILEGVEKGIRSSLKKGEHRMELQLHPPSLGRLRIEIHVKADHVSAALIAENHMIKEILEMNVSRLREALLEHGLRMEGFQVHVNAQSSQNGHEHGAPSHYGQDEGHLQDEPDDYKQEVLLQEMRVEKADGFSIFI